MGKGSNLTFIFLRWVETWNHQLGKEKSVSFKELGESVTSKSVPPIPLPLPRITGTIPTIPTNLPNHPFVVIQNPSDGSGWLDMATTGWRFLGALLSGLDFLWVRDPYNWNTVSSWCTLRQTNMAGRKFTISYGYIFLNGNFFMLGLAGCNEIMTSDVARNIQTPENWDVNMSPWTKFTIGKDRLPIPTIILDGLC